VKIFKIVFILSLVTLFGAGCALFGGPKRNSTDGGVYQSGDYGNTWQAVNFVGYDRNKEITISNENTKRLMFHPEDKNIVFLLTENGGVYRSDNAGAQWSLINETIGAVNNFTIDKKEPNIFYASQGGNILKSTDEGINWETIYIESRADQIVSSLLVDFFDNQKIFSATNTGSINFSDDGGLTWKVISVIGTDIRQLISHPTDSRIMFAVTRSAGIYKSNDSAATWEVITDGFRSISPGALSINDVAINPNNPAEIYVATDYTLMSTTNGGADWQAVASTVLPGTLEIRSTAIDPQDKNIIYFTVNNKIHRSSDGGANWSISQIPTTRVINQLLINDEDSAIIYAGFVYPKEK
jgi:photosystem II stability/assembly factor-like uncharacterized protein